MAITTRNTQVQGLRNSASISPERKHMMKKMQAMFLGFVLAVGLLTGSAVADEKGVGGLAADSQTFTALGGIRAETMSDGEMDLVQGKLYVPCVVCGSSFGPINLVPGLLPDVSTITYPYPWVFGPLWGGY